MATQEPQTLDPTLEEEIFGGDLSDLSSDEGEPAEPLRYDPEVEQESSDDEAPPSGDEYRDRQLPAAKFKKTKRVREEGEEGAARPKKQRKKRTRQVEEEEPEDEAPLDPEEAKRRALDQRLDAILKKPKPQKKKRVAGEEDLGDQDEESMMQLRRSMIQADQADRDENSNGRPAIYKLKMLPEVVEMMQKKHLELVALDSGILGAISDWLRPMDDKSLPSLTIQRAVFAILIGLSGQIDSSTLKESKIGPLVLFYSKCPRVDNSIKRTADSLITAWLRPLMRRSAMWRDRPVQVATEPASPARRHTASQRHRVKPEDNGVVMPTMVRNEAAEARRAYIPQAVQTAYTIAPRSNVRGAGHADRDHGAASLERFKAFSSKLKSSRKKVR